MAEVRKHIVFHGLCTGCWIRYTAKYLANSLNLVGWVRTNGMEPLQWKFRDANG